MMLDQTATYSRMMTILYHHKTIVFAMSFYVQQNNTKRAIDFSQCLSNQ